MCLQTGQNYLNWITWSLCFFPVYNCWQYWPLFWDFQHSLSWNPASCLVLNPRCSSKLPPLSQVGLGHVISPPLSIKTWIDFVIDLYLTKFIYIKKKEVYSSSATSKQWKYFLLYELMKMYLKVFNCFIYWTMLLVLKWWKWTYSSPNTFSLYDIQKFVTFRTYMFKKKKNNVLLLHSSKRLT